MTQLASLLVRRIQRWLSMGALIAFAVPAHATVFTFNNHWDGDWNLSTGFINGNFFVDTLPFPMLTATVDTNTTSGTWFGSGVDSIHFTYKDLGSGPPTFGGFTSYGGTITIDNGTGHYSGATGTGTYIAYSIPDPKNPNILKTSVFQTGEINAVPEPSTNMLLLAGAA